MLQQQFAGMELAPDLADAADELATAALLNVVSGYLRTTGYAEPLSCSIEEWASTIRSAAVRTIRDYVQRNLMAQRVFAPDGRPYCATCRVLPCACSIGLR